MERRGAACQKEDEKMSILYKSTRGVDGTVVTASQAILQGLAKDGGLFVPTELPKLDVPFPGSA